MNLNHGWAKFLDDEQKQMILDFSEKRYKTTDIKLHCFDLDRKVLSAYWIHNTLGIGKWLFNFNTETNEITTPRNPSLNPLR